MTRIPRHRNPRRGSRLRRIADQVSTHVIGLGLLVLLAGALLLGVGFVSTTGPPLQSPYRVQVRVPDGAPLMRRGQAVRVGGRLAGLISDVKPDREGGGAILTANITKPQFRSLPTDTAADVRVQSLVYETYLDLQPGNAASNLRNGDRLQTPATSGVGLLDVVQLFDRRTRENLQATVVNLGYGTAGRGTELNAALADVPELAPALRADLDAVLREPGALGRVVVGASQLLRGARGTRADDVSALIAGAAATLRALDERRSALGATIDAMPATEDEFLRSAPNAEGLLNDLAGLAKDVRPAARSLRATLPAVNRLMAEGETLRSEVRRIAAVADPVLTAGSPVVFGLFPTMTTLGPINVGLKTLLQRTGPYRDSYRVPGERGVKKGTGEIGEAGNRFIDATDDSFPQGLAAGAPAWRVAAVLTPRPCLNPFPKPGQADADHQAPDGTCIKGAGR